MADLQELRRLAEAAAAENDIESDWFDPELIESDEPVHSSRAARRFTAAMTPQMALRLILLADRFLGVPEAPAPQERELVGWQFRYVFEDQGNRRAAWGCVLQGAPSFTSGYRSYNGWQRRYFHEVRRVYADPVEPYVEDPHHKPDTAGVDSVDGWKTK